VLRIWDDRDVKTMMPMKTDRTGRHSLINLLGKQATMMPMLLLLQTDCQCHFKGAGARQSE
jgi:hypothetical protein